MQRRKREEERRVKLSGILSHPTTAVHILLSCITVQILRTCLWHGLKEKLVYAMPACLFLFVPAAPPYSKNCVMAARTTSDTNRPPHSRTMYRTYHISAFKGTRDNLKLKLCRHCQNDGVEIVREAPFIKCFMPVGTCGGWSGGGSNRNAFYGLSGERGRDFVMAAEAEQHQCVELKRNDCLPCHSKGPVTVEHIF